MPGDDSTFYEDDLSGYDLVVDDGVMTVTIRKNFDRETRSADWVGRIVLDHNEAYQRVVIDMGHCVIVSSSLYAGIIRMAQHYNPLLPDGRKVALRQISQLVDRTLQTLRVHDLFEVESIRDPHVG